MGNGKYMENTGQHTAQVRKRKIMIRDLHKPNHLIYYRTCIATVHCWLFLGYDRRMVAINDNIDELVCKQTNYIFHTPWHNLSID